jgi:ribose 5-phosphate isomerase B
VNIALGCDHAGFALKEEVRRVIEEAGHKVKDVGTFSEEPVDYPDFAEKVGLEILQGKADRGITLCGSGVGACIAANKMRGIRAGVCHDVYTAAQCVEHDDVNLLCLGARVIGPVIVKRLVETFLEAEFKTEERYVRRLNKILAIEKRAGE